MNSNPRLIAFGAVAALGLASATAAQDTGQRSAANEPQHQMTHPGPMTGHNQTMMSDSEMRGQMTEMMGHCNSMMRQMGDMPHDDRQPTR